MKKELGQECPNTWYLADIDNYDTRKSQITLSGRLRFVNYTIAHHCCDFPHQHQTWTNGEWERKRAEQPSSSKSPRKSPSWKIGKESGISKHCQGHNGPEGWAHITRSQYTVHRHIEHITISESRLSINFKICTKHRLNLKLRSWPNLASEYWPRFNFVTSTKHQQQNTDPTSASKSCLNFNFKILTKVLNVWTQVKLDDKTSAPKSATNSFQHDPHHQHRQQ